MFAIRTKRPRDVNAFRAASILYGDWGTSKAYVIGLAFAIAGYSSFWLIAAVSILTALVGINYTTICKYYPMGGGVYASVRKRSELLSLVGAFFLVADYLVTAALSALSSFYYIGVPNPGKWAIFSIVVIGILNFFGPKHTGSLALLVGIPAALVILTLAMFSLPHLHVAAASIEPISGNWWGNWTNFVGIIVALSGIESIANITGVMKLDAGSSIEKPSVYRTATPAIIVVMLEVCILTTLLGLAANALPLRFDETGIHAPNYPNVRDSMLRYMGEVFVSAKLGPDLGHSFGLVISIVIAVLLLSAVNTAIVALVSLLFVISRDGELPNIFQKLNAFGVPSYPLIFATLAPVMLLLFVHDVAGLADLYAVGFVGAIATNLGSTSTDKKLNLSFAERYLMMITFVIMAAIEITLLIDKPHARRFAFSILATGLFMRAWVKERYQKKIEQRRLPLKSFATSITVGESDTPLHEGTIMCAVSTVGKTLDFALQESKKYHQPLYLLFVREQKVITELDRTRSWLEDEDACRIFDYALESSHETIIHFYYTVSDSTSDSIVDAAKELKASRLILGMSRSSTLFQLLRGNVIRDVQKILPEEIDLIVLC